MAGLSFQSIQNLDDGSTVLGQVFLSDLNIHLGLVLLHAQLSMLLKPPGGDLTFANTAQYWGRGRMISWVVTADLGQMGQVLRQNMGPNSKGLCEDVGKVDGYLTVDCRLDHPHGLQRRQ